MSTAANASALARRPSSNPPKKLPCNRQRKVYSKICVKSPGVCVGGGGGGTLIFSYIRRLGSFFWFKILKFNIFGGFQKNKYFLGYEDFVDIFGGHQKIGLHVYLGVIYMHVRDFS